MVYGCWLSGLRLSPCAGGMIVRVYSGVGWRRPFCLRTRNDRNMPLHIRQGVESQTVSLSFADSL